MRTELIRGLPLRMVLLASALGLSVEYLLQAVKGASLCSAQSCELVGESLRFQEDYLVLLGAIFFWAILIGVSAAERRGGEILWQLVGAGLLVGLAFEGALLGYQFSGFEVICWLCLTVSGLLLLSSAALAWRRRSLPLALLCLCIFLAATAAPGALQLQPQNVQLQETDFLERRATQSGPSPELYLFFSLHCSHCSEVFANLALSRPWSAHWHFVSIDTGGQDLARLAKAVKATEPEGSNVFLELLRIKQTEDQGAGGPVPEGLSQSVRKARAFFQSRGYAGIPLLIAREEPGRQIRLTGTEAIGKYLWEKGLVSRWLSGRQIEQRLSGSGP